MYFFSMVLKLSILLTLTMLVKVRMSLWLIHGSVWDKKRKRRKDWRILMVIKSPKRFSYILSLKLFVSIPLFQNVVTSMYSLWAYRAMNVLPNHIGQEYWNLFISQVSLSKQVLMYMYALGNTYKDFDWHLKELSTSISYYTLFFL